MDLSFFRDLVDAAGPQIGTLLALVAGNTILAVGVAIKVKKFEWQKIADFYTADVVPKLLGYLGILVISEVADFTFLGPDLGAALESGLLAAAWLAIVLSLGGRILANIAALGLSIAGRVPGVVAKDLG